MGSYGDGLFHKEKDRLTKTNGGLVDIVITMDATMSLTGVAASEKIPTEIVRGIQALGVLKNYEVTGGSKGGGSSERGSNWGKGKMGAPIKQKGGGTSGF